MNQTHTISTRDDSIRFSLAQSRLVWRATPPRHREREREKKRERKKERKTRCRVLHTRQGHHHSFNGKRKGMTREEESPFQPQKKKKKKKFKREMGLGFFCSQSSFLGHTFLLLLLWDFFKLLLFLSSFKNLSLKKKNGRQKRPPKHQLLRLSTGFLRYHPIGRTCVVALSVSFSLSLFFVKGKKKKKRKRADDDDADDVSRNDFVVVLLHGCNEN